MENLFYYYKATLDPFRSVMDLTDEQIVEFMNLRLPEEKLFHKDPAGYIRTRRDTETWLREGFQKMGGEPADAHPIYMTLGRSSYIESIGIYNGCVEVPLSLFSENAISFTYPDSYVSKWLASGSHRHFKPGIHGRIFGLSELPGLLADGYVHNDAWKIPGREYDFFVEAQVWNREALRSVQF